MTQPYGFLTQTGRNKEAAALANGTALDVTHIVLGDGDYAPTGGELALQNEIGRLAVMAQGQTGNANEAFFRIELDANDGPYSDIREAGLVDADGDLIAIVKYPVSINKPLNFTLSLDLIVVFSDLENLVIQIDAQSSFVPGERQVSTGSGLTGGGDMSADRTLTADFATQADALAGTSTVKVMSPARSKAAINAAVNTAISNLVGAAPETLDTMAELAAALGDDPGFLAKLTKPRRARRAFYGGS